MTTKLSKDFVRCLRHFAFYYTNGTLNWVIGKGEILEGIDYRQDLQKEASLVEQVYAIYANNIQLDESGTVVNQQQAMRRAAQYIRSVCDATYEVEPALEEWEMELH
jgi:hypothetical protein